MYLCVLYASVDMMKYFRMCCCHGPLRLIVVKTIRRIGCGAKTTEKANTETDSRVRIGEHGCFDAAMEAVSGSGEF